MGGPAFDRQVFVKKQQKTPPPSRSLLPGGIVLLLVAALASFATYRYVKAGGAAPSNPADTARIKELQTKLKQSQARVQELEKRHHVSPAKHLAVKDVRHKVVNATTSVQHDTLLAEAAPRSSGHVITATHNSASSLTNNVSHTTVSQAAPEVPPKPSASAADNQTTKELKAQLTSAQAASNKKLDVLQNGLTANHEEWQAATNRLGNVVGELDSQRNAIQRNQNSVNYLLERVHRSDVAFTLKKGAGLQRVGPISMKLASASVKGQHYSIRMIVDDKTVILKDRALNEVVEFYTSRSKYPLRLIVSQIQKGQVSGTLAVPFALGQEVKNPQLHELQAR